MKHYFITLLFISAFLSNAVAHAGKYEHIFCGGPSGGTFMFYANAISNILKKDDVKITAVASKGSIDNIRMVDSGAAEFGIVYTEDVYQANKGELRGDNFRYKNVRYIGFLYYAPVQIIVRKDSGIYTLNDLKGKRVAVGGIGSGSASNAERLLSAAGVWSGVTKYYIGYRNALGAFNNKLIDALWIYAGAPNATVAEAEETKNIRLLDLSRDIEIHRLTERYPFIRTFTIPADTYSTITKSVNTLSGAAILVANNKVPDEDVYFILKKIYSDESVKYLYSQHSSAKNMMSKEMMMNITTPFHPGALRFWKEKGFIK